MRKLILLGLRIANRFHRSNIAILKYHSVQDRPESLDDTISPSTIVPTAAFRRHMRIVAKAYNPVTMDDILRCANGEADLPRRPVAVTFDDGYRDNYAIARPILNEMGIKATIYVTAGSAGNVEPPWFCRIRHAVWSTKKEECLAICESVLRFRDRNDRVDSVRLVSQRCARLVGEELEQEVRRIEDLLEVSPCVPEERLMMNWDEIREMSREGHLIGSHTISHPNVSYLETDKLQWELTESRRIIEKNIGQPVEHFSYPNPALSPHMNAATTVAVRNAGYKTAVVSTCGKMNLSCDVYSMKRTWSPADEDQFVWNIEKALSVG